MRKIDLTRRQKIFIYIVTNVCYAGAVITAVHFYGWWLVLVLFLWTIANRMEQRYM